MPITTIKRCQSEPDWWFTVEDTQTDYPDPQTGLTITYFDENVSKGKIELSVTKEDALLIRDAINQLYPLSIKSNS
jgi:hypothetical protein